MAVAQLVKYKVSESYDKGGIRAPDAAVKYGSRMLTLAEIYPFFENEKLWNANKHVLREARPVWVRIHAAISRLPLGESIQKEGNRSFLVDTSEGITWRQELPERLLDGKSLTKSGQLFIVENGVTTRQDGANEYTSLLDEKNDMRSGDIPTNGWTKTTEHPILFGTDIEALDVPLQTPDSNVKVGLVSAGTDDLLNLGDYTDHRRVDVPDLSSGRLGVLVYEPKAESIIKQ